MNLKFLDYLAPIFRWWWVILISTIIAGGIGYLLVKPQPPVYKSGVTLMVGGAIYDPNPTGLELEVPRRLTDMYAAMAQREPIRNATMEILGLDALPEYSAFAMPGSPFLRIEVTDTDPRRAQAVANTLAEQLVQQSPSGKSADAETQAFVSEQLQELQDDITQTKEAIAAKQDELGSAEGAAEILTIQQELDALNTKLTSLQTTYANLLASTQGGAINTLEIIEKAPLPIHPIGPNKLLTILGAAFGGLMLSVIGAYGVEYLDDRLKTPTDIERAIPHPVLAHIPYVPHETHLHTYMAQNPRSPTADAFRSLRNNLGFLAEPPFRTILVSSAMPGEGKSTVATNLALSLSHAGYRVVLVDADLRAPSIFSALDLPGKPGLSDILKGDTPLTECINTLPDYGIDVIVSGAEHEQSTELLVSRAMQSTLDALLETYDVVVIDGPPFAIPDAVVLSRRVDGILWVTRTNASRRTAIRLMQKQIAQTQTRVFGVVINGGRDMHTRYYQAYGYSHYYQHENGHRNGNGHKKPRWKFPEWKKIPERKKSQQKS